MIKGIVYTLLILIFVAFQATVGNLMEFFLAVPQFVLMLCLTISILNNKTTSMIVGIAAGLVLDIAIGQGIGLNALLFMYLCLLTSWLTNAYYNINRKTVMISCVLGNLIYSFLYYILAIALWGRGDWGVAIMKIIIPEIIWTAILCIPIYIIIKGIDGLLERR